MNEFSENIVIVGVVADQNKCVHSAYAVFTCLSISIAVSFVSLAPWLAAWTANDGILLAKLKTYLNIPDLYIAHYFDERAKHCLPAGLDSRKTGNVDILYSVRCTHSIFATYTGISGNDILPGI